jgi:hypothetical protein
MRGGGNRRKESLFSLYVEKMCLITYQRNANSVGVTPNNGDARSARCGPETKKIRERGLTTEKSNKLGGNLKQAVTSPT